MALQLLSGPIVEPVSLPELKEFMRIDAGDTSQDNTISTLAVEARTYCETFTGRKCVQQTWGLYTDFFPGYIDLKLVGSKVSSPFVSGSNAILVGIRYAMILPFPPVQSIAAFTYLNANGSTTAMTQGTDYIADLLANPARLTPPFGQVWPVARVVVNAVQLQYISGYATPITITTNLANGTVSGHTFASTDVGCPISIPGAGPSGATLNTIVASVSGGTATLRDRPSTVVTGMALIVDTGNSSDWERIRRAIKVKTLGSFETRMPESDVNNSVEKILYPMRDLRF